MRFIWNVAGVFMGAALAFVAFVAKAVFGLVYVALSVLCFVFLLVALFSGVGFLFTHTAHTAIVAASYLAYAAGVFGVITVIVHLRGLASQGKEGRALERMSGLRLANPQHSL